MFGSAVVGVFDVLTFRIVDPPDPPPAALAELHWAVMSVLALVVGLVISCVASVMRHSEQSISTIGKLLYTGAGVSLIVGAMPLAWGVIGAKGSFRIIATSASSPTIESVQGMMRSAEPQMTIEYGMFVLSAVMLLAAGLTGLQARPSQASDPRTPIRAVVAIGSALVGVILILLMISIWFNGNALRVMMTDTSLTPKPAELAAHLSGILNKSLIVFVGLGVLGLLQLLASLFPPLATPDANSKV